MSCCGQCCFWKLNCGDMLSCCDLFLVFFGLVLYFTENFHCFIPEGQKVSLLQVFNLRVEIVRKTTVLDLEWGPDMHQVKWNSSTSSAGTDLNLDLQQWWWQQLVGVMKGLCSMADE